jgi:hypothetical protein
MRRSLDMTNRRNIGASVRARLLERAREQKADFQILLTRYTLERLLYRLSLSAYRDRFILKGAMLFSTWVETPFRPTRDLDLLGRGPWSTTPISGSSLHRSEDGGKRALVAVYFVGQRYALFGDDGSPHAISNSAAAPRPPPMVSVLSIERRHPARSPGRSAAGDRAKW